MKREISLGEANYYGETCPVTIEVEIKESGELSICGNVWKPSRRDCYSCGQNYETIVELFPNNKAVARLAEVWKRWHLNHMHPECEHQRADGWHELASAKARMYNWTLTMSTYSRMDKLKKAQLAALAQHGTATITDEERRLLNLKYSFTSHLETLSDELAPFYELDRQTSYSRPFEDKTLGWLKPSDHPNGILGKPCPVCGYEYGTKWLKEELPADIVAEVTAWTDATFKGQ